MAYILQYRTICHGMRMAGISLLLFATGSCHQQSDQTVTVRLLQGQFVNPDDLRKVEALSAQFTQQTGIRLETIRGIPAETVDQLALVRKLLQQRMGGPDVLEVDETWLGTLKDDLIDLRPYLPNEAGSLPPAVVSSYVFGGKVVAVPYQNHAGVLEYRADLLHKYGYDHSPRSWTELEKMALRIQTGERAHGNADFWGYTWPGAAEESLTCNALEWQVDEGGGRIIENHGAISVNNLAAIRAWERARHWIGWISPPSVKAYNEIDVDNAFDSGRSAFVRVWGAGAAGGSSTPERTQLRFTRWGNKASVGEAGYAEMPGGSVARVSTLGGEALTISKFSEHPKEGAILIRFLVRQMIHSVENAEFENFSAQWVIYDGGGALRSNKVSPIAESSGAIIVSRPTNVAPQVYDQVTKAYSSAVHSVISGEKKASDAASELERDLVRITGLHAGPPERE